MTGSVTPLPGQYEYFPGSDAISWAIRVLPRRGAVTADNSEAVPLKVGLLGLQKYVKAFCCVHIINYAQLPMASFRSSLLWRDS